METAGPMCPLSTAHLMERRKAPRGQVARKGKVTSPRGEGDKGPKPSAPKKNNVRVTSGGGSLESPTEGQDR